MIADSTVWIDFINDRRTWQADRLAEGIADRTAMMVDPVRQEVLAGLLPAASPIRAMALFDACEDVMQLHRIDAEQAAAIYRVCRVAGDTIRSHADCLIAAIAIRNDVPVLHRDHDYDMIARRFPLRVVTK
jgi:Predicted nucleic acid-binding protein, contains PIN domain